MAKSNIKVVAPSNVRENTGLVLEIEAKLKDYANSPQTKSIARQQSFVVEYKGEFYEGIYNRHFDQIVWEFTGMTQPTEGDETMTVNEAVKAGIVSKKGFLYTFKGVRYANIQKLIEANPQFTV